MDLSFLPGVNAVLNATAAVLLVDRAATRARAIASMHTGA